jgi:hypothetical protein
MLVLEQGLG